MLFYEKYKKLKKKLIVFFLYHKMFLKVFSKQKIITKWMMNNVLENWELF